MNQDIKKEWVAALRSGAYEQGIGELKMESDNSKGMCFCCLGVLTDLYAKEKNLTFNYSDDNLRAMGGEEFLCEDVMEWAGLTNKDPTITDDNADDNIRALSDYNDNDYCFADIAKLIDDNL